MDKINWTGVLLASAVFMVWLIAGNLYTKKQKMEVLEILAQRDKLSEAELLTLWPDKTLVQLRKCAQSLSEQNLIEIVPKVVDPSNLGSSWDLKITAKGLEYLREKKAFK